MKHKIKNRLAFVFTLLAMLTSLCNTVNCVADGDRPNILFIAIDDLRPAMGSYGDAAAVTPHMDKLAKSSLQFNQAHCQVAVCNPSRASLMTGMRPDKLGVWTLPVHFREAKPDAVTLPQWFRKFGYTAVSHGKIYHNPTPDPQSWSEPIRKLPALPYPYPDGTRETVKAAREQLPKKDWRKNNLRGPSTSAPELADTKLLDGAQTDMAIEDLRRLGKSDKPFFLAMGYIRPHLSLIAPKTYWDMHDPAGLPVLPDQQINPNTPSYALSNNSELAHYVDLIDTPKPWSDRVLSPEKAKQLVHGYYACVSYVDAQIGRLLSALEEEGLADNTIVVLWSDHGWKFGEYRGWGKMTNYEIDTRVPLMIRAPDMQTQSMPTAGKQTNQLVELLDLFPTLCDLAKIDTPDFVDGKSLASLLADPNAEVHPAAISQYFRRAKAGKFMGYSIRTPTHRMIEWRDFSTGKVKARELYDHQQDDSETVNIIEEADPDLIAEISTLLNVTHPPKPLVMIPAIHSTPTNEAAEISFKNKTTSPIFVYKISRTGQRPKPGKTVKPNAKLNFKTKIGTVFVVESLDGKIHEIHSASAPKESIKIQTPQLEPSKVLAE